MEINHNQSETSNLQFIRNYFSQTNQPEKHIFTQDTLSMISQDLTSHYFTNQQTDWLMKFSKQYIKDCQIVKSNQRWEITKTKIQELGQDYYKNINGIYFKHHKSVKILEKLFSQSTSDQSDININDLEYDLMNKSQILHVSKIVKQCCQQDLNAFYFLSSYLKECCIRMASTGKYLVVDVEKQLYDVLDFLRKQHPPNDQKPTGDTSLEIEQMKKLTHTLKISLTNIQPEKRCQKLEEFICDIAQIAKDKQDNLIEITRPVCYKSHGLQYKTGLKVKSKTQTHSIDRVKEKLLYKKFKKYQLPRSQKDLQKTLNQQTQHYKKTMNEIFCYTNEDILFTVSDMSRGKCMFQNLLDIKQTALQIINYAIQRGYPIQIDNRLNQKTTDLVFKIKIGQIINEFQLAYKFNIVKNEFNHKLYELARSKFYSVLSTLFIFNERSREFFNDILCRVKKLQQQNIEVRIKMHQKQQLQPIAKLRQKFEVFLMKKECRLTDEQKKSDHAKQKIIKYIKTIMCVQEKQELINLIKKHEEIIYFNGIFMLKNYKTQKALQYFENAKNLIKSQKSLSKQQIELDHTLDVVIAENLQDLGKLDQSLEWFLKILSYQQQAKTGKILDSIGQVYYRKKNLSQAFNYFQKALKIYQKYQGQDNIDAAGTLSNIGLVYKNQGNHPQALKYYQKCLNIKYKIKGVQSIDAASTLSNIGMIYKTQGDYHLALNYYERCLKIQQKVKGEESIDTALTLNNMGGVFLNQKNFTEALKCYEKCLKIQQKTKGQSSLDTAVTLNNIGGVYDSQGNYTEALSYYQRCLKIKQKHKGLQSIDTASTLNNIGMTFKSLGKYQQAQKCYKRSLKIQSKVRGSQSIECMKTYINLAFLYETQNDYDSALICFQHALKIREKLYGPHDQYASYIRGMVDKMRSKVSK